MAGDRKGITVAGSLIADCVLTTDTYPAPGFLAKVQGTNWNVGGTGNLILDLARMDPELPVKVSAVIGDDEAGHMFREELGRYPNIHMDNVTCLGQSSVTYVVLPLDTRQRTFFFQGDASDRYGEEYIDWDRISCEIFVLEYLLLMKKVDGPDAEFGTRGARILHDAQQRGMKTSVDVVSEQGTRARAVVPPALRYTNYCVINELEAEAITGIAVTDETAESALHTLRGMGVSDWAVIHTASCAYGLDCTRSLIYRVPSLELPEGYIVGNTGAGDAYCGGILYGSYKGMDLEKSMRFAAAAAACSLSAQNGTDGLRPADAIWELEARYRSRQA